MRGILKHEEGFLRKSLRTVCIRGFPESGRLKRVLGFLDIVSFGISATVGSGVFVSIGYISKYYTGPSLFLCFVVVVCAVMLSALCFAEFSSRVNMSGIGYSYTYATYGELVAFCVGILTFLSYSLGNAAVARGWGDYVHCFVHAVSGYDFSDFWTSYRVNDWISISVLAPILCMVSTLIALSGMKESAFVARALVIINLGIMVLFVSYGLGMYGDVSNLSPPVLPEIGWIGVIKGSGLAFFCMIGWDLMCSMTEEMKNPKRDLPRGILTAVVVVGCIYCGVSLTLSAMVPVDMISVTAPVATAFLVHGDWNMYLLVSFVATSICMANVLTGAVGPPRVLYTMANDGLLFAQFGKVVSHVPFTATIVCGLLNVLASGLLDFHQLASLTSCFSLIVYILVCGGVLILRTDQARKSNGKFVCAILAFVTSSVVFQLEFLSAASDDWKWYAIANLHFAAILCVVYYSSPKPFVDAKTLATPLVNEVPIAAPFKCPLVPIIPMAGMWVNSFMLASLGGPAVATSMLVVLGCVVIYAAYGMKHSRLAIC